MAKDLSDYYRIYTPFHVPLRFCADGYYRLTAKAECRKCGRSFMQILRCHRYRSPLGIIAMTRKPDPNEEKVMTSFMLRACEHGIGNPRVHTKGCSVGSMKKSGKVLLAGMHSSQIGGRA